MPFAQWLQCKMEQHDFSNYRIAKMAGVHQSTVSNWLAGSKPQAEKEKLVRKAISDYENEFSIEAEREKQGIKKDPVPEGTEVEKLTDTQKKAWELICSWDDEKLGKFIAAAKAMLGE